MYTLDITVTGLQLVVTISNHSRTSATHCVCLINMFTFIIDYINIINIQLTSYKIKLFNPMYCAVCKQHKIKHKLMNFHADKNLN